MSEFKTPQSRNEAILQNILGASNLLVSPQSRVEAILQAILNETEYNEEAQSRIEEILLAILHGDDYDGEGFSRNEKILIAGLKGEQWTEEPQSRIEELLIEWANSGLSVEWLTYTGTNIAVLQDTLARPIKSFTFFGKSVQDGTPTPEAPVEINHAENPTAVVTGLNQWDEQWELGTINQTTGEDSPSTSTIRSVNHIAVKPDTVYYVKSSVTIALRYYDINKNYLSSASRSNQGFTTPSNCYYLRFVAVRTTEYANDICINLYDESVNGTYEPHKTEQSIGAEYTLRAVGTAKDTLVVRADGTGKLTRKISFITYNGARSWNVYQGAFYRTLNGYKKYNDNTVMALCDHFKYAEQNAGIATLINKGRGYFAFRSDNANTIEIYPTDESLTTTEQFRSWLASNPVTVIYELATPVETELTAEEVAAILNGAQTYSPNTTIIASNDNGVDQDFEIEYAHKAGASA